jgi:hypothetical protein
MSLMVEDTFGHRLLNFDYCCYNFYKIFTVMEYQEQKHLIRFLKEEFALPNHCVELGLRQCQASVGSLPIVLWQLARIFDWLEMP